MTASKDLRAQLYKKLGEIGAALQANDAVQEKLAKAADRHHDQSRQDTERLRTRLGPDEFDSDEANEYDDGVMDRRRAAMVAGHLRRGR